MKYIFFIIYTCFIVLVSVLAYLNIIPTQQIRIPYYDYIGHFILYGIWAYLFAWVLPKKAISISTFYIPWGIVVVMVITIIEECLQSLSTVRTFSLNDLGFSLMGIVVGGICFGVRRKGE